MATLTCSRGSLRVVPSGRASLFNGCCGLFVHCVGDGAVRQVLNAYEAAQKANGRRDSRHRIEPLREGQRFHAPVVDRRQM